MDRDQMGFSAILVSTVTTVGRPEVVRTAGTRQVLVPRRFAEVDSHVPMRDLRTAWIGITTGRVVRSPMTRSAS